jgi:hypothetical protein
MKRSLYNLVLIVALVAVGLIAMRLMGNLSILDAGAGSTLSNTENGPPVAEDPLPAIIPTMLADMPDIEYVPVYQGASITVASDESIDFRHIVYEVGASIAEVTEFYKEELPKKGWVLRGSRGQATTYTLTPTSQKSPWHLYLVVVTGLALDESKTFVNLNYGRYPDTEEGLPVYSDAYQISSRQSDEERQSANGTSRVNVNELAYLSDSDPKAIADFYNDTMPSYGWFFYDWIANEPSSTQTGQIVSPDGLYFMSRRSSFDRQTSMAYDLYITASIDKEGRTFVKLHLETREVAGSGF